MPAKVTFTVGNVNVANEDAFMDALVKETNEIKNALGELTPVFNRITNGPSGLIQRLKNRFDNDALNTKKFRGSGAPFKRSQYTRLARRKPKGPTLKDTGKLRDSIGRLSSPTKSTSGGQSEVNTLRIGSRGVRYATDQLMGGVWTVDVFQGPTGKSGKQKLYPDMEQFGKSNSAHYGSQWRKIRNYTSGTTTVDITPTDFLLLDTPMRKFIQDTITRFLNEVVRNAGR